MNSETALEASPEPPGKGKRRADDATEHTPLLTNGAPSSYSDEHASATPELSTRTLRSRLTFIFLISLSFCVLIFVILALLAWSYAAKASRVSPDDVLHNAMVFEGPQQVDVLNLTSSGELWINVDARMGMNAGSIIGVNTDREDDILQYFWKALGRWGVRSLDRVSVTLSRIDITSQHNSSVVLASITTQPFLIPLTADPPKDLSWLTNVSTLVLIRPTNDTSALLDLLRESWRHGSVDVVADVGHVLVKGGGLNERGWRDALHKEYSNVRTSIGLRIPPLPGLPQPGRNDPIPSVEDLITLTSFSVSSEPANLALRASATVINPAPPTFNLKTPSIPFIVSLISSNSSIKPIPVASVSTAPFTLTQPNITLNISGSVLPLAAETAPILSTFLARYLSKQPNPILITCPLFLGLAFETSFPSPDPPPRILRNVTIRNMKIKPGNTFLASGTVFARVVLPKGINVDLNVSRVLPDVLVFDGEVPDSTYLLPPQLPLPDPLPERAFGHIRPEDWLDSVSVRDRSEEGEGAAYAVSAKIVDVPLEVLPGRQKEFSNFVSKVIFGSDGALAGILGTASVAAKVRGLPIPGQDHDGEMELHGLPFRGSVRVGKKSMYSPDMSLSSLKRILRNLFAHAQEDQEAEDARTLL
ncbi:hypothetical protein Hypma_001825 [Hypsizygus marmoreus]|uniref:Pre-rRNA processing protein n=1 Tax=Hypsizygus marmoreus TaxID=39966 RepID=A0A369J7N5_HYPMA|nr:hypothetical protein Hypma_001825 [Hypsizygus marmoreus]